MGRATRLTVRGGATAHTVSPLKVLFLNATHHGCARRAQRMGQGRRAGVPRDARRRGRAVRRDLPCVPLCRRPRQPAPCAPSRCAAEFCWPSVSLVCLAWCVPPTERCATVNREPFVLFNLLFGQRGPMQASPTRGSPPVLGVWGTKARGGSGHAKSPRPQRASSSVAVGRTRTNSPLAGAEPRAVLTAQ